MSDGLSKFTVDYHYHLTSSKQLFFVNIHQKPSISLNKVEVHLCICNCHHEKCEKKAEK